MQLYPKEDLIAWIDLSTYCNAGCPQCHRTDPTGLGKQEWLPLIQWNLAQFKKMFPVDTLDRYNAFEFCGTWGDPIMNKDIYKIVAYLVDNSKSHIHINTNGSIRDPDWWWKLGMKARGQLAIYFDIDGIDQKMHERYRQKTDLEKIKDNVEAYCTTPAIAHCMTILFRHNQEYTDQIWTMTRDWGMTGEHLLIESDRFYRGPSFEFIRADGVRDHLDQIDTVKQQYDNSTIVKDHRWKKRFDASGQKNAAS